MKKRTVAKAISWEAISNTICLGLAYVIFGNFGDCLFFTGICIAVKLVLFYWHDQVWHTVPFGKDVFIEQPEMWDEEYHKIFDKEYQ